MYSFLVVLLSLFVSQPASCTPPVGDIGFDDQIPDYSISQRIAQLHREDQAIRQPGMEVDGEQMVIEDRERRIEIMELLEAGQVVTAQDLFSAALIFQHGDCPEHYQLAAQLAERSAQAGYETGYWLYAAATDRYLLSMGELQRYGMQYTHDADGLIHLCPVDTSFPDAERTRIGMDTLAEAQARTSEIYALNHNGQRPPEPATAPLVIAALRRIYNRMVAVSNCYAWW